MSEFRYDRLLEIKEKLLEYKQAELEIAIASVAAAVSEIEQVERETAETYDELTGRSMTGKELSILTGHLAYLDAKKARLYEEKKKREASPKYDF